MVQAFICAGGINVYVASQETLFRRTWSKSAEYSYGSLVVTFPLERQKVVSLEACSGGGGLYETTEDTKKKYCIPRHQTRQVW